MTAKKYDYIIIYSILFASILSIAALVRLLVIEQAVRKEHPQLELEPRVAPIESTPNEEISVPNYGEYKQAAQQKIQQEQTEVLESVLTYTVQELALYLIFLLTPKGWTLSPAYDINPDEHGMGLKLNISGDDNSPDFELALAPQRG